MKETVDLRKAMAIESCMAECRENARLKLEDPAAWDAKRLAELPLTKCAMCMIDFKGYGHNAQPILTGEVCDECHVQVVKQRFRQAH
eukprot:5692879-Prymnesium_polylepis.1